MRSSHLKVPKACSAAVPETLAIDVCEAVSDVFARVGDKWSLLVIHVLSSGTMRSSELKRSLGPISQKVLTATLRGLERDGYVSRSVTPSVPARVDYELTAMGHEVLAPVTALATWAMSHRPQVKAARAQFDIEYA
ncbi:MULTISPECIES: helix-turn-helix domain-containing protein [Paraburkholderia]|uniref:Transcriptional regulator, HxlR family n=1 Tax=Paraburkholderia megapolitana TaxID=420953 RepID=A0A1I3FP29_9BURK|nr:MULTISPECIES: helix-turn-helix domain-containing protein [Paraburkholderia]MCX4163836.1 helix-turn-helix domain-containing protein [Paraburkholderia megapolitana]MDN7159331.1 helix-turn-helix transcriptional regulator [Paraburkholderia sp. CHISQ3]MDQ6496378.1 helix-turn-helix transcriptional regulator [Paraburkholderia megapolitana]QDQ82466.1 helix-turn-helix transcriptional regulator [Paraburkholderia megapolitana]SFI12862.1 transcriptional regulator, HxlR family [Paraburkholderia megapoli